MKIRRKIALGFAVIAVLALTGLALYTRAVAHWFVTNPVSTRKVPLQTPADFQLPFEDVVITNKDGLRLVAWYIPSENGAAIIIQHGYKECRDEMLAAATALHRHGYGVLLCSVRAHDLCDGEQITFGIREVEDMKLWVDYLTTRSDLDPDRIAALGNSMGGSLVIQLAALDSRIKAVAADSAFSSLDDTVATSVTHFTGLSAFPFAPLIRFWARVETGCDLSQVNAKIWIKQISPRPVFLMQGGADDKISRASGELLNAAANGPKEFWFDPSIGHANFSTNMPAYEQRLTAFFDRTLRK